MNPPAKEPSYFVVLMGLYASEVGAIVELRFLLFFLSRRPVGISKSYAKKEAQEAFDAKIN
jgi:hypothetical protein